MQRNTYLDDILIPEAWQKLMAALDAAGLWPPLGEEQLPLPTALGRVTARPIYTRFSSPHYHGSAMDGYAVRAIDIALASGGVPVRLAQVVRVKYVDTGDPIPPWADAVIPVENVRLMEGPQGVFVQVRASVAPRQHVRLMGEDLVATELVLPANHTLRPVDLGAIAAGGHAAVWVRRKPRVAVVPKGSEVVPPGVPLRPGDILDYNTLVLAAQAEQWGGAATRCPIVPDDRVRLEAAVVEAAADHDLVLLNAGSSAGSEYYSALTVQTLGQLLVHGIAVRPGHPVVLGPLGQPGAARRVPIIGVPGFPVGAALTGELCVEPLLTKWLGRAPVSPPVVEAVMTRMVFSPPGDDEYLRVTLGEVSDRVVATPLSRGAGAITSLTRADGITVIPRLSEGLEAGERVRVQLLRPVDEVRRTIVAIGSHDLTLDFIAQFLAEKGARLSSANVGSRGGLVALRRDEAHLAGSHLLDPETGDYNRSYIKKHLPDTPVALVTLVGRTQGLLVGRGNPLKLRSLADLARPGVRFVNRQHEAGTRVRLDHELSKLGLPASAIRGYDYEEHNHPAAVASGTAGAGLVIAAAAHALELDFVPLFMERYDLVIPRVHYESPRLRPLLDLLHDERFRRAVASLRGYDVGPMGTLVEL